MGYLGLGVASPTPEWGTIISENKMNIGTYPYLGLIPGICICLAVMAVLPILFLPWHLMKVQIQHFQYLIPHRMRRIQTGHGILETGAGKTTLALSVLRLLPAGVGEITEGSIIYDGSEISSRLSDSRAPFFLSSLME